MFDRWKLKDFAPGQGIALGAHAAQHPIDDWLDALVPGDVHSALLAAGRIADPFYDRNSLACAWVEQREWWYRCQFAVQAPIQAEERLQLIFHGLDTEATIWLDGQLLGQSANMFCAATFDVSQRLQAGVPHTLALRFAPPPPELPAPRGSRVRKAWFGYGADGAPRLPTIGIWQPVELRRQSRAAIQSVYASTVELSAQHDRARLVVRAEIERFAGAGPIEIALTLTAPDAAEPLYQQALALAGAGPQLLAETAIEVEQPRLWWTHDLGEPALYTLTCSLLAGGVELDQRELQLGIRTLALDQSPDSGEDPQFRFVLNGLPIFARGASCLPLSPFAGALTEQRYERLLLAASAANMTMLRVWGGGTYAHDCFYDLCDRLGLLVWQDLMFADASAPGLADELRYQATRLRGHACLALWCANGQAHTLHPRAPLPASLPDVDALISHTLAELDPATPYWSGSPASGAQLFGALAGEPIAALAVGQSRFITALGLAAAPAYETLRRCLPPDQLAPHSPAFVHHSQAAPREQSERALQQIAGPARDLAEYIDFSMLAQAEVLKRGIEHFRRRNPHCAGMLLQQLNDCWPGMSSSIMDSYGFEKAAYYAAKRAYAPVLASFEALDDGSVELWICNDTRAQVEDIATIELGTFDLGASRVEQLLIQAAPGSSRAVWRGDVRRLDPDAEKYLAVRSLGGHFPANRHFFAPIQDLWRPQVAPTLSVVATGPHALSVRVQAPAYALFFHLLVPYEQTRFSDNYFDMVEGESCTIEVTNEEIELTPAMLMAGWL